MTSSIRFRNVLFRTTLVTGAIALLAWGALATRAGTPALPTWTIAEGAVQLRDASLEPWRDVPVGETLAGSWSLRTVNPAGALLVSGESRIRLAADTYLSARDQSESKLFAGPFLSLGRGAAVFELAGIDLPVATPFFNVDPGGTRFVVEVEERHGAATVGQGVLELSHLLEQSPRRLEPGETAVVDIQAAMGVEMSNRKRADSARARTLARRHHDWLTAPPERPLAGLHVRGSNVDHEPLVPGAAVSDPSAGDPWNEIGDSRDLGLDAFDAHGDAAGDDPFESGGDEFPGDGGAGDFPGGSDDGFPDDDPMGELPGGDDPGSGDGGFPDDDPIGDFPDDDPIGGDDGAGDLPGDDPFEDFPNDDDAPGGNDRDPLPPWWSNDPLGPGGGGEDEEDDEDEEG
jgi:hypothetical protein